MEFKKVFHVFVLVLSIAVAAQCSFCGTPFILRKFGKLSPYKRIPSTGTEHVKVPDGKAEIKWNNIRIKTFFQNSYKGNFSSNLTTSAHWDLVERTLNENVKLLQNSISVRQLTTPILFPRTCEVKDENGKISDVNYTICDKKASEACTKHARCADLYVDDTFADSCYYSDDLHKPAVLGGAGIKDADLALFVYILSCKKYDAPASVLAAAMSCSSDSVFHTPTSGVVFFCIENLNLDDNNDNNIMGTALHEITHVLFSNDMTSKFHVDENGNSIGKTYKNVVAKWLNRNGTYEDKVAVILTHPSLIEFGKKHWGCSTFHGIQLHNDSGTFGHFNERLYTDALMTPTTRSAMFTELDVAALEATGWYKVDNCALGVITMAKRSDKGCDFVSKSCYELLKYAKPGYDLFPYCFYPNNSFVCTRDGEQIVRCETQGYDVKEYFDDCGFYIPFNLCSHQNSECAVGSKECSKPKERKRCTFETTFEATSAKTVKTKSDVWSIIFVFINCFFLFPVVFLFE